MFKVLILFIANLANSVAYALYIRRAAQGNALEATIYDGILMTIIGLSILAYTKKPWFLVPIVLGAMLGTYIGVALDGGLR
jgi:presenilin-like A22 family membrane protease